MSRGNTARKTETATGGFLQVGNPGNKGGMGQPASYIRARCREAFAQRIGFLERLADGKIKRAATVDRVRAMDMLGKYGALQVITVDPPDRPEEAGELMMARVLTMVGRALLSAPAATRTEMLGRLAGIEAQVGE